MRTNGDLRYLWRVVEHEVQESLALNGKIAMLQCDLCAKR